MDKYQERFSNVIAKDKYELQVKQINAFSNLPACSCQKGKQIENICKTAKCKFNGYNLLYCQHDNIEGKHDHLPIKIKSLCIGIFFRFTEVYSRLKELNQKILKNYEQIALLVNFCEFKIGKQHQPFNGGLISKFIENNNQQTADLCQIYNEELKNQISTCDLIKLELLEKVLINYQNVCENDQKWAEINVLDVYEMYKHVFSMDIYQNLDKMPQKLVNLVQELKIKYQNEQNNHLMNYQNANNQSTSTIIQRVLASETSQIQMSRYSNFKMGNLENLNQSIYSDQQDNDFSEKQTTKPTNENQRSLFQNNTTQQHEEQKGGLPNAQLYNNIVLDIERQESTFVESNVYENEITDRLNQQEKRIDMLEQERQEYKERISKLEKIISELQLKVNVMQK